MTIGSIIRSGRLRPSRVGGSKDAVRRLVCFDFPLEATQPMNIREVMTPNPQCVSPGDSIQNAARIMRDCDTGAVPVVENGRPVGILTDRDIVVRVVADGGQLNRPVSDIVSANVVCVTRRCQRRKPNT
jgi:predicted transcriptional regulator